MCDEITFANRAFSLLFCPLSVKFSQRTSLPDELFLNLLQLVKCDLFFFEKFVNVVKENYLVNVALRLLLDPFHVVLS